MKRLSRRALLRGAGGVAVGLPALEIMTPGRARAAVVPTRFVLAYGGSSLGSDTERTKPSLVAPASPGPMWEPTRGLAPVDKLGMRGHVGIVSGLKVPWGSDAGSVPPAGRIVSFHGCSLVPQVTGRRILSRDAKATGASADQIVADAIGATTPQKSLVFRVQPTAYNGGSGGNRGRLSWGASGAVLDPIVSPRLAYQSLFASFTPPAGDAPPPAETIDQLLRRSVLSVVKGETERLLPRLSAADKLRMQRHFDEIRDLETRVLAARTSAPAPAGSRCMRPADPGADPAIGASHRVEGDQLTFTAGAGYSNEELRGTLLDDFVAMAFACNLTRVASIMYTLTQCFMSMEPLTGKQSDLHEMGHSRGTNADVADGVAWHVGKLAALAKTLGGYPEVDGKSVLDHTAMVMVFEGGYGADPEGGAKVAAHSTENMVAIIAGHAGGFRGGDHVVAKDRHPGEVILTAMRAVGVTAPLGDLTAVVPGLVG